VVQLTEVNKAVAVIGPVEHRDRGSNPARSMAMCVRDFLCR
jgi:hypothetical protein